MGDERHSLPDDASLLAEQILDRMRLHGKDADVSDIICDAYATVQWMESEGIEQFGRYKASEFDLLENIGWDPAQSSEIERILREE